MQNKRVIAGVVGIFAIVLLVYGCYSRTWLYESRDQVSVGIGLLGAETCEGDRCVTMSYDAIGERDATWKYIGYAGTAAVLGTGVLCLLLVVTSVLGLARTSARPGKGVTLTLILSILALIGGAVCAIGMKRGFGEAEHIAYGSAMMSYLAGAVAAIVSSALLRSSRGAAPAAS